MQITGTFASCMTLQHGLKAFVFTFVGFSFAQWAGLIIIMIASGALGTFIGLKVLKRVPAEKFMLAFKIVVTLLALRLLWQAFSALFPRCNLTQLFSFKILTLVHKFSFLAFKTACVSDIKRR